LNSKSIIPWHYDSYPYVCVIMLSETESMLGGETYIKGGDGIPAKVESQPWDTASFSKAARSNILQPEVWV